jgi:hypothetical protein
MRLFYMCGHSFLRYGRLADARLNSKAISTRRGAFAKNEIFCNRGAAAVGKIHTKVWFAFESTTYKSGFNAAEIVFPFGGVLLCTPAEKRRLLP